MAWNFIEKKSNYFHAPVISPITFQYKFHFKQSLKVFFCLVLSYVIGTKHGIGNCIVFDHLEEYYPEGVRLFKEMKDLHQIELPTGLCKGLTEEQLNTMMDISLSMEPLWENALGENWRQIMTREKLRELYLRM